MHGLIVIVVAVVYILLWMYWWTLAKFSKSDKYLFEIWDLTFYLIFHFSKIGVHSTAVYSHWFPSLLVHFTSSVIEYLNTHTIDPDSNTIDEDSKAIHYEWAWELIELFPTSRLKEFSDTIQDLLSVNTIRLFFIFVYFS